MTSFWDWNATTANSNGNADTTANISIVENATPPSNINNGMRGMMWRLKQVHDDDAGIIVGTGTANAHVAVTKNVFAAYASGITFTFKPVASNTAASTLNANAVGIKAIRKYNVLGADVALTGGEMLIGKPYRMLYDSTANAAAGAFLVLNPDSIAGDLPYSPGTLYGLTLSNNVTDATNDIDIAVGAARNSIDTANIDLQTGLTKRADAVWAAGTGNGGRFYTTLIDGTLHFYVIKNPSTGVVDAGFSDNATNPTGGASYPAGFTIYRRVGSIYRLTSIQAFRQIGNQFKYVTPINARSSTAAFATALLTLAVPGGIIIQPILRNSQVMSTVGNAATSVGDGNSSSPMIVITQTLLAGDQAGGITDGLISTNTSQQINYNVTISSGTLGANVLDVYGWYDARGQEA